VYNQADHIQAIVASYEEALSRVPWGHEFLLVVNGSRDRSFDVCQEYARGKPSISVLNSEKGGWGLAVKLGINAAQGSVLCYTNSARTAPRDLTLCVLYAIANPGTVIKANRKMRESFQRRLGSLLYNLECRALFDLPYWDVNGTPKVFPREFVKLLHLTRNDDLIDAEFNAICRREGYPILEVLILFTRRHGGKSTTNYRSAVRLYAGAYRLKQQLRDQGPEQQA